ncbi:hypothetical protein JZ751_013917, partial [Albula glossodonta]
ADRRLALGFAEHNTPRMMVRSELRRIAVWMLVLTALASRCETAGAFFSWMRKGADPPPPVSAPPIPEGYTPPFEMSLADEKFLAEAKQMELSPLDSCHYRVVAQLKSTCSSLSEEQLAKLGVVLFNCQSEVEGRKTYPCTEEMSLKECTASMDADTWNAYHIVSNRARSVCYATRQLHFRRKAELTVNALIATATSQLDAMKDLKDGQQELKEVTAASLEKVLLGHSALQEQQGALQQGQDQLESSIKLHDGHQAILDDLAEVRGRAQDIYGKIELHQQPALDLTSLSLLLLTLTLGHWFLLQLFWGYSRLTGKRTSSEALPPTESPKPSTKTHKPPCLLSSTPERTPKSRSPGSCLSAWALQITPLPGLRAGLVFLGLNCATLL